MKLPVLIKIQIQVLGGQLGINQSGVHNIGGNDPQSGNSNMHFANIHFCDGLSYGPENLVKIQMVSGNQKSSLEVMELPDSG